MMVEVNSAMARQWLSVSLYGGVDAPGDLPPVVSRVARHVRVSDPDACFFFSRDDHPAGRSVDLWVDAGAGIRREVTDLLRAGAPGSGWQVSAERLVDRPVHHPHESERDVTDELAAVASEFALSVRPDGAPGPREAYDLAVAHLRALAELVEPSGRAGLLFQCWERWSAGLSAGRRVELAAGADPAEPEPPAPRLTAALERYVHRTRQTIRRQRPGCGLPERYLVFAQSAAVHDRLGIPVSQSAAAALTVRARLTAGQVPATTAGERA